MPVVGDFQIVTTGGNFRSSEASFTQTGGRYGKGYLSYLLVDWVSYQDAWVEPGHGELLRERTPHWNDTGPGEQLPGLVQQRRVSLSPGDLIA